MKLTTLSDDARIAFENLGDLAGNLVTPTVRLGVTGLSRSGKTVFITALVHNLIHGGRLPLFSAAAQGRISDAYLQPQPDDALPRFTYEKHLADLLEERVWPTSTNRISQLRLTVDFESARFLSRTVGGGRLNIDIVDYPGEWLLDLPLLAKDYATWSEEALTLGGQPNRQQAAQHWLEATTGTDGSSEIDESTVQELSALFTAYLKACRADDKALSMLPPGRFLMPGDLEGSPAVTFAPLIKPDGAVGRNTLWAHMERRYDSYRQIVVKPFFRDHFARLDRQIVLVDALSAVNAGPDAVHDLEGTLAEVLTCFRPGKSSWLSSILSRKIDRILFAATKADHLHRDDHRQLENLLKHLLDKAMSRAKFAGAKTDVAALASVRATREANFTISGETLPCIAGTPMAGEVINGDVFDGTVEKAIYPGRLEDSLARLKKQNQETDAAPVKFVRFRPPKLETTAEGLALSLPHIRLDKAMEFLLGDKLV